MHKSISCKIYLQPPQISKAKYIFNTFFAGLEPALEASLLLLLKFAPKSTQCIPKSRSC